MKFDGAITALLLATLVAGCDSLGGSKKPQPAADPNTFPQDYRKQIAGYLAQALKDLPDFRTAVISEPALKPVADTQRYVVCVRFELLKERIEKSAIFLSGAMQQFIDAKPEQCGGAIYKPFPELAEMAPK